MRIHALHPTQLPWPVNWNETFGDAGLILLEIGFGNGGFLANLALERPEAGIIGVEISSPSIRKAQYLIDEYDHTNVRIVQASAQLAVWTLFGIGSIQGVYINFPDPWPKAKHHKRRVVDEQFLNLLATRMTEGAHLDIATDHREYALWISERLNKSPSFSSRLRSTYTQFDPDRAPTKYEQKALTENSEIFFFKWQRNQVMAADVFPIPKEFTMPHVILDMTISIDELGRRLGPFQRQVGEISIRTAEYFKSVQADTLLCDAFVTERHLDQRIMLAVIMREVGDTIIQVHGTGYPRPTEGVKLAIRYLAEEIVKIDPRSSILRHNLGERTTLNTG